jgi:hypothetical protein
MYQKVFEPCVRTTERYTRTNTPVMSAISTRDSEKRRKAFGSSMRIVLV